MCYEMKYLMMKTEQENSADLHFEGKMAYSGIVCGFHPQGPTKNSQRISKEDTTVVLAEVIREISRSCSYLRDELFHDRTSSCPDFT